MRIHERWGSLGMIAVALAGGCNVGLGDVSYTGGAGTGGAGTGGATSSSSTGAGGADCSAPVSDEFKAEDPSPCWRTLAGDEHLIDKFGVANDTLTMSPKSGGDNGWFNAVHAPFLYQNVSGNFILVAQVNAHIEGDYGKPPQAPYNTAGLLVRDPASSPPHDSWLLYDIGFQGQGVDMPVVDVGTMVKVTTDSKSSKLPYATVGDAHEGKMAICRVGDTFHVLRFIDGSDAAPVEAPLPMDKTWSTTADVQVGLVVGSYAVKPDVVGTFSYARFAVPKSVDECLTLFNEMKP